MKKTLLAASALLALSVTSAKAADPVVDAMYDWTGLYAGLNAGYAFGGDDSVGVYPASGHIGELSLAGFFGGVQAGYNHQMDNIVLGIEGDIQMSGIDDKFSDTGEDVFGSDDVNYFGTLRARAGFAADQTLIYATGGLAFASFDYYAEDQGVPFEVKDSFSKIGWVIGGGVEQAIDDSWSVKVEYLYANFGKETLSDGANHTEATPDFHSVRLGVNFKF